MREQEIGRLFRMLRYRREWTQVQAAEKAGISRAVAQKIEHGDAATVSMVLVRKYAAAFDLRVDFLLLGRGAEVARLLDEEHAQIVGELAAFLKRNGWVIEPEASFNVYGDRGRVDLLAYHPGTKTVLMIEVKTILTDLGDMFGSMNVKQRVVRSMARERHWEVETVGTLLAVADTVPSRGVVRDHAALFDEFEPLASGIRKWLAHPTGARRMLLWIKPSKSKRTWIAGRRRVRRHS